MIRTDDEDQLVPCNDEAFEAFAFNRAFDKAEFRCAALDRFGDLSRVADCQPDLDARVNLLMAGNADRPGKAARAQRLTELGAHSRGLCRTAPGL
jgi:hypothetical protein